jgi:glycosyltransferase involved in cell wall biosynthesis
MTSSAQPLVSVLIPVYNAGSYLARCLDSALGQTYPAIELVVVDDGSTDSSPQLIDRYAARHDTLMVVEHQANAGAAAARNRAIELSHGAYVCFMDNDDWMDEDMVERLVEVCLREDADLACCGYRRPTDKGAVMLEAIPQAGQEWAPFLVEAAWAKLYRRELVVDHALRFLDTNIDEDLYFTLPATLHARRIAVVPHAGYNWFYNTASVSNTAQRSSTGLRFESTMDDILDDLARRGLARTPLVDHYFVRLVTWFVLYTRAGDGRRKARENLRHYRAWLDEHIEGWRRDPYARPGRPVGDALQNRLATWLFVRHSVVFGWALDAYGVIRHGA